MILDTQSSLAQAQQRGPSPASLPPKPACAPRTRASALPRRISSDSVEYKDDVGDSNELAAYLLQQFDFLPRPEKQEPEDKSPGWPRSMRQPVVEIGERSGMTKSI